MKPVTVRHSQVVPRDDLIEHELNEDCVCGPDVCYFEDGEPLKIPVDVHHSLDGREMGE